MKSMNSTVASRHVPALFALAITVVFALDFSLASAQSEKFAAPNPGKWDYAALAKVPEKARIRLDPLENDPEAVAAGGKLYEEHCAECHGMKGEGGSKGANLRANEVQQATPGSLFWILTNGVVRRGMPVWSKLPEPERWQLVAFIRSFRASATPESSGAPQ